MFKTKLTVEFDVETQFGPESAISVIDTLTGVPAIISVNVVKLETDYESKLDKGFPRDIQSLAMKNIPLKIR
jgi:hypothetical protein